MPAAPEAAAVRRQGLPVNLPLVGIDTGGTFTDFVFVSQGRLRVHKEASTPSNPAEAILAGLTRLIGADAVDIVHGSTVATNALLERRGARVALLTTAGFEDLLRIGRQARPSIYDIDVRREEPLVGQADTHGVAERCGPQGEVLQALHPDSVGELREVIAASGVDAVAICLLHSYANARHEVQLRDELSLIPGLFVCASSDVLPEFREYERCSTTVVNAYVGPVMQRYLEDLKARSHARHLRIMQSSGGALSIGDAAANAVHTVLSGPAGGVIGAFRTAADAGMDQIITFDMGGTSTDVSLCPGRPLTTSESTVAGLPIRIPVVDIHTVGAGGGSIAYQDPGGALRVGPRSAGADPGPVCYGRRGVEVTVTDANLVLGRLVPEGFLGGAAELDVDAAHDAVDTLALRVGLSTLQLAEGIVRIANATMEAAIRVISVERGHDPADFTLVSFGGAGGMHAAALAESLGILRVLVPPDPGVLSALGMLRADAQRNYSRSVLRAADGAADAEFERIFAELEAQAHADELLSMLDGEPEFERTADLRYHGQGFELNVAFGSDMNERFHAEHERRYGYSDAGRPTEVVTVRLRASIPAAELEIVRAAEARRASVPSTVDEQLIVFQGRAHAGARVERESLRTGDRLVGPAVIIEYSATTVVPPGWAVSVDSLGNLILEREPRP
jgi:N-methylhydantoinase A